MLLIPLPCPRQLGLARSAPMCRRPVQEAQPTSSWAATKDQSADRRQRTLEDAPGSDDTFGLEAQRPASISIANQASLKGKGLRHRGGPGVGRPCQGGRPAAELPSLDAIPVDPRAAEKKVVATSLLTVVASLIDQNLNWCRKRALNTNPIAGVSGLITLSNSGAFWPPLSLQVHGNSPQFESNVVCRLVGDGCPI